MSIANVTASRTRALWEGETMMRRAAPRAPSPALVRDDFVRARAGGGERGIAIERRAPTLDEQRLGLPAMKAGALARLDDARRARARADATFRARDPEPAPLPSGGPSLQDVLDGNVVMHGQVKGGAATEGDGVRDLQQQLRDAGYDVPDTGVYDDATEAAVRDYQAEHGLTVNGHVNRETATALRDKAPAVDAADTENAAVREVEVPATAGMTEEEKYDHYQQRLDEAGVEVDTDAGEKNVLILRRETDADARGGKGEYDDVMVVMWVDEDGNKHVRELPATADPSGRYDGKMGEDVNGDGLKDQGRLPAGYHDTFQIEAHDRLGTVLRPDHAAEVERDTQHDGSWEDSGDAGRSVLVHEGGNNATGSAGCVTMPPGDFADFMALMREDPDGSIPVTVLDM